MVSGAAASELALGKAVVDHFVAKWCQASQRIDTLDVRFVRLSIDSELRDEQRERGRFYWESTGRGSYQIEGGGQIVWNDGVTLVYPNRKQHVTCSAVGARQARDFLRSLEGMSCSQTLARLPWSPTALEVGRRPDDLLPLATNVDAQQLSRAYALKWGTAECGVLVSAVPRDETRRSRIRQIDLILDPADCSLRAHRIVDPLDRQIVHIIESRVVNASPADRGELLAPNLDGSREVPSLWSSVNP
jgi:hypothetical protein